MPIKFEHLCEMDEFMEMYNLPKLIQEGIENLNSPITQCKLNI